MLPSLLTTFLFSFSVIFAARSSRILGGQLANLGRICLATILLALWAHIFGGGLRGASLPWFFLSGIVGFGMGDVALFAALPRIGPRLAILLTQCLAAPVAALVEWLWLGTTLRPVDLVCAGIILAGVAVALAPDHGSNVDRRTFCIGVLFGIGSALGQAFGAVLSRKANDVAALAHFPIDGGTAAYQRIIGGVLMTVAAFAFSRRAASRTQRGQHDHPWRSAWPAVVGNALTGPAIGVGCYQWALKTTPSGIVLPIVATAPLVTIALSFFMDGVRPARRAVTGSAVAVAGAVALKWVQNSA